MESEMGVWIDSRTAVIMTAEADGSVDAGRSRRITTDLEKQLRLSSGERSKTSYGPQIPPADDKREKGSAANLRVFFGAVAAALRAADVIFIFGPGEAKDELKKRLAREGLGARVDFVEPAERMSDRQIAAKVRGHFARRARSLRIRTRRLA
jgi:hypothetical protein